MSDNQPNSIRIPIHHNPTEDAADTFHPGPYPDRMEITLHPQEKRIEVRELWYLVLIETEDMKRRYQGQPFHFFGNSRADIRDEEVLENYFRQLRDAALSRWNGRLQIIERDRHTHKATLFDVVFKIERTKAWQAKHWIVNLNLFKKTYTDEHVDSVNYHSGTIDLHLNSMTSRRIVDHKIPLKLPGGSLSKATGRISGVQVPVAHEFGHTLGMYVGLSTHADEYDLARTQSEIRSDVQNSVMAVGNRIEKRHADFIVDQLNSYYNRRNSSVVFSAVRNVHAPD